MTEEKVYPSIPCLQHGHVTLVDHMGSDKRILDAARVSYQRGTKKVSGDRTLLRYLMRKQHWTPFEKVRFEFHVKLPIFVARQWMRHRASSYNEVSLRYSEFDGTFYVPEELRKQSQDNRQGSSAEVLSDSFDALIPIAHEQSYDIYQTLVAEGMAKELARGVLPVNAFTEFYWTIDLRNLFNFLSLRLDSHAQYEIRVYAEAIYQLMKDHCDLEFALEAFEDYILDAPDLTKYEMQILVDLIQEAGLEDQVAERLEKVEEMSKRERRESSLHSLFK